MAKNPDIKSLRLTDFSGGLNTRQDARKIADNESPALLNIDITDEGAIITRKGYTQVAEIAGASRIYGIIPFIKTTTTAFRRLFFVDNNANAHYLAGDGTVTTIGAVGGSLTGTATFRGSVLNSLLIFGNGTHDPRKYDGSSISAITTYAVSSDNSIFTNWGGTGASSGGTKMYGAGNPSAPTAVYFSANNDPNNWDSSGGGSLTVSLNDGENVTGIVPIDDNFIVFKYSNTFICKLYLDSSLAISSLQLAPAKLSAGCVAPSSIAVVGNDIVRLADPDTYGITSLGFQQSYFTQNQRNNSLSWKIQPTVRNINRAHMQKAAGIYFNDKYIIAVPYETASENDTCFVYSTTIDGRGYWTTYNDIPADSFALFRNDSNKNELYFGSNIEGKIFKFDDQYSDNGAGYRRFYRTKIFDLGDARVSKKFHEISIRGAKPVGSVITLRAVVDGVSTEYTIDDSAFETSASGGIIGDHVFGDAIFGGNETTTFNRFMYRDNLPMQLAEGREIYFEIENSAAGQPWKVDFLGLKYEYDTPENYPMTLTSQPAGL